MFDGWDVRNILQAHSIAIIVLFLIALLGLGALSLGFRGSVVV